MPWLGLPQLKLKRISILLNSAMDMEVMGAMEAMEVTDTTTITDMAVMEDMEVTEDPTEVTVVDTDTADLTEDTEVMATTVKYPEHSLLDTGENSFSSSTIVLFNCT